MRAALEESGHRHLAAMAARAPEVKVVAGNRGKEGHGAKPYTPRPAALSRMTRGHEGSFVQAAPGPCPPGMKRAGAKHPHRSGAGSRTNEERRIMRSRLTQRPNRYPRYGTGRHTPALHGTFVSRRGRGLRFWARFYLGTGTGLTLASLATAASRLEAVQSIATLWGVLVLVALAHASRAWRRRSRSGDATVPAAGEARGKTAGDVDEAGADQEEPAQAA